MSLSIDSRRQRARQVGRLMQSYRLERKGKGRSGRLSQTGLLALMGRIKPEYGDYSHSTVARWESGETLPTRERLEVFGAALDLPRTEIDGLIALAGLDPVPESAAETGARGSEGTADVPETPSYAWEAIKFSLSRFFVPGLLTAGVGYYLASLGWNAFWVLMTYVSAVIGLVLFGAFLRIRRKDNLRELYFTSVFVLLSTPMFQATLTRMDPYGFYSIEGIAGTPIPFLLAFLVNLCLALVAGLMFDYLWKVQYTDVGTTNKRTYARAHWAVLPPLAVVYFCALAFGSTQTWIYLTIVFPMLDAVFTTLAVLREKGVSLDEWTRKFMLGAGVAVLVALSLLGGAATIFFYQEPSLLAVPDHNLFRSWELDFNALGYPADELEERLRMGTVWTAMASLGFIVVFIGGHFLATIHRSGGGDLPGAVAEAAPAATAGSDANRRRSKQSKVDVRYRPAALDGFSILQPVRSSAVSPPY